MAQREGSVYLYLFIVAGVLFLVMTVLFFVNNADKQEYILENAALQRKVKKATEERRRDDDDLTALKELIAGPRAGEWEEIPQLIAYVTNDELKGKAEKAIGSALTAVKEAPRTYTYLVEPYADLESLLQRLLQGRTEALASREAASSAQLQAKQDADATIRQLRDDKQASQKQISDLEARYEDLDNRAKTREAALQTELETVREQSVDEISKLRRVVNWKDNEIRSLQRKLQSFQDQMAKDDDTDSVVADGTIQYVLAESGKAWIDLGRADHLTNGARFRVFQTVKGGRRLFKGAVEVQKISDRMSEVRIVEELDPMNPIVKGDFVASPFYDRDAKPVFVFAGTGLESANMTQQLLVAKMQSYGATINSEVDEKTDFIVATKDYENSPEFKTARELQVKVIRERDLLEYLGF